MKKFAVAISILIIGIIAATSFLSSGEGFDLIQRIKYKEYYSWRDQGGDFPRQQFIIGFNTDRHKEEIFVNKTRRELKEKLPLLVPIDQSFTNLVTEINERKKSPDQFMQIQSSYWLLEFDDQDKCINFDLVKG